jgi:hypothetical protein
MASIELNDSPTSLLHHVDDQEDERDWIPLAVMEEQSYRQDRTISMASSSIETAASYLEAKLVSAWVPLLENSNSNDKRVAFGDGMLDHAIEISIEDDEYREYEDSIEEGVTLSQHLQESDNLVLDTSLDDNFDWKLKASTEDDGSGDEEGVRKEQGLVSPLQFISLALVIALTVRWIRYTSALCYSVHCENNDRDIVNDSLCYYDEPKQSFYRSEALKEVWKEGPVIIMTDLTAIAAAELNTVATKQTAIAERETVENTKGIIPSSAITRTTKGTTTLSESPHYSDNETTKIDEKPEVQRENSRVLLKLLSSWLRERKENINFHVLALASNHMKLFLSTSIVTKEWVKLVAVEPEKVKNTEGLRTRQETKETKVQFFSELELFSNYIQNHLNKTDKTLKSLAVRLQNSRQLRRDKRAARNIRRNIRPPLDEWMMQRKFVG